MELEVDKNNSVFAARALMALTEEEDIIEDYSDIVPKTTTAFDQLFIDEENMKVWALDCRASAVARLRGEERGRPASHHRSLLAPRSFDHRRGVVGRRLVHAWRSQKWRLAQVKGLSRK